MTDQLAAIKKRWLGPDYSDQSYAQADQDIRHLVELVEHQQLVVAAAAAWLRAKSGDQLTRATGDLVDVVRGCLEDGA